MKGSKLFMQLISRARLAASAAALLTSSLILPIGVLAHEHRDNVDDKYTLVVGWQNEPAYVGQPNAATVRISLVGADPVQPMLVGDGDLHLQLNQHGISSDLPLLAVDGKPGMYSAQLVPDQVGDVRWSISGTIDGDSVQELFTSADGKFEAVTAEPNATASIDTSRMTETLDLLDRSGLHDLDMSLQDSSASLPDGAMDRVHAVDMAFAATTWPVALQDAAGQLTTQLDLLHATLEMNDMSAAAQATHAAHEQSHAFSSQARAWIAGQSSTAMANTSGAMPNDMSHVSMPGTAEDGN